MLKHPNYDEIWNMVVGEAYRYVYVIRNKSFWNPSWYFFNIREGQMINGVIWTQHMSRAYIFPNEETVEEFKMKFISPRKVEILRIEKELV